MSEAEQRIKYMKQFSEHQANLRRERIWSEVALAVQQDCGGHPDRLEMLKWGVALELGPKATEEQRASQRELLAALKAFKVL